MTGNIFQEKESNPSLEYLIGFEKFRELMVIQMNMTAAEELTIKLDTRKLEVSNEKLLEKIQGKISVCHFNTYTGLCFPACVYTPSQFYESRRRVCRQSIMT